MKKQLNLVENWSRWCECHNGALPIFDLTGYECQKCAQVVCVNCIYDTQKGFLCADCIKKVKPKQIKSITPPERHITQKYLFILVLFEVFSFIATFVAMTIPLNPSYITLITSIPLAGLILIAIAFLRFQKTKKGSISSKKLKALDKKARDTKD